MKTILVPTDFSPVSKNALLYAAGMAKQTNAEIILFHAYQVPVGSVDVPVVPVPVEEVEQYNKTRMKRLESFVLKNIRGKIQIRATAMAGFATESILAAINLSKPDVVVMGVSGAGKVAPGLYGSTAVSVMRRSEIPVMLIPSKSRFTRMKRIVLACDYQRPFSKEVVAHIKKFVNLYRAKLLILNVVRSEAISDIRKDTVILKTQKSLQSLKPALHFPESNDFVKETNAFMKRVSAGMLVMIPHTYNFLEGIFHQSKTKKMAFKAKVPLLSIRDK